jgi:hypothetical protein
MTTTTPISTNDTLITDNITTEKLDPDKNTVDKTGVLRFDFLFSYWVIIWFFIFYFTPEKFNRQKPYSSFVKTYMNPSLAFYFALVENAITLLLLITYDTDYWTIVKFIVMISILKVFPLYLLRNYTIVWERDIIVLLIVFGIYNVYLAWYDTNVYEVYKRTFSSIKSGSVKTPLFALWNKLFYV